MNRNFSHFANILIGLILFLSLNVISNQLFLSFRIDMTEERLYTLSDGTKTIIDKIENPINLKLYFSIKELSGFPDLQSHGKLARDMLEEYVAYGKGTLRLTVIDPERFSEAEDEARADGIHQISLGPGSVGYLGIVATNSTDGKNSISLLQPGDESSLEYDFSKMLLDLTKPQKKKLGLLTGLPLLGPPSGQNNSGERARTWAILDVLKENFTVNPIKYDISVMPDDINVLLVVHPKDLPDSTQYAIEQFVLNGGKMIMFIDPLAEGDPTAPDPTTPGVLPVLSSNPKNLLAGWGIRMTPDKVVADPETAVKVNFRTPDGLRKVIYLPWIQIRENHINRQEFSTNGLTILNVGTAGSLEILKGSTALAYRKLFDTPVTSGLIDSKTIIQIGNPSELFNQFQADEISHTIALRVSGTAESRFLSDKENESDYKSTLKPLNGTKSGAIDIIVVADTDILSDRFWTNTRRYDSTGGIEPFSSNADFLVNALELYGGGGDLIGLRTRGKYSRPFEIVESLRRQAESNYREQEKSLKTKLRKTEERLVELENSSDDNVVLSKEQRSEIERFRLEQLKTRKELRSVQHKLIQDIEQLGTKMKFVNTGLIPALILVFGILVSLRKSYV